MKEYLFLYKSLSSKYYPMKNNMKSGLWDLNEYFLSDYKYYDLDSQKIFDQDQVHGQETIIINDQQHQILYIVIKDHDTEEHIPHDNRPDLTNEFNSCKINYNNFIEFRQKWLKLKQQLPQFAIMYRDENDWIDCKGFDSQEEMELFVKNYQPEVTH